MHTYDEKSVCKIPSDFFTWIKNIMKARKQGVTLFIL